MSKTIPQSTTLTVFDPGHNYKLLPALAKNMPQAYFLYASRPLGKGADGKGGFSVRHLDYTVFIVKLPEIGGIYPYRDVRRAYENSGEPIGS